MLRVLLLPSDLVHGWVVTLSARLTTCTHSLASRVHFPALFLHRSSSASFALAVSSLSLHSCSHRPAALAVWIIALRHSHPPFPTVLFPSIWAAIPFFLALCSLFGCIGSSLWTGVSPRGSGRFCLFGVFFLLFRCFLESSCRMPLLFSGSLFHSC